MKYNSTQESIYDPLYDPTLLEREIEEKRQSLSNYSLKDLDNSEITKFEYCKFFNIFKKSIKKYNFEIISLYIDDSFGICSKSETQLSRIQHKYIGKSIKKLNSFNKKIKN